VATNGVHFPAYDGNGNIAGLVSAASGAITARFEYGSFAEPIRVSGAIAKAVPLRFSTKYLDEETGLLHYGYRYYDPSAGRWVSRDPMEEEGGLNLNGFVFNDPVNLLDPLGLFDWCACAKGLAKGAPSGVWGFVSGTASFGWNLARHPIDTPKSIVNGFADLIRTLRSEGLEEVVAETMPELYQLTTQWDQITDETKCYLMGRVVGEYGAGIASGVGATKIVNKLRALKAAETAPGTTRLWRAVEPAELKDVMKYGDYNIHPNSTFKRFAFDEGSLDTFIKANPDRTYTKTFVDLPNDKLKFMYEHADPGGVGRSIGIDVYEKPEFYDWFNKVHLK